MSTNIEESSPESATSLIGGILGDLQQLIEQQIRLTREELGIELQQRATTGGVVGAGVGILFLGVMFFCLSLVHWLHWMTSVPGSDPGALPLWASFALVAAGLVVIGGIVAQIGRTMFRAVQSSSRPATEKRQEEVQWTIPPK